LAAKLISKAQPLVMGVYYPRGVYSRVVSIGHSLPSAADQRFVTTPPLANKLWLLGIRLWFTGSTALDTHAWWFTLRRGSSRHPTQLGIWQWEDMLPVQSTGGIWSWNGWGTPVAFEWSMNRLYEGQAQKFALIWNLTGALMGHIQASFEISEG